MLERIQIDNFQCHEQLRVKLDPKITAIVGPSDSGKSAFLRAIRWLALNRPRGDSHIRNGEKVCTVQLQVDDKRVKRYRSSKENSYTFDGIKSAAVKTDVPEHVANMLKLSPLNFQGQHESPFWFNLSAGEVAKQLNNIVDLNAIDEVMASIASKLRSTKAEMDVVIDRVGQAQIEVKDLDFVDEFDEHLGEVEEVATQKARTASQAADLASAVSEGVRCRKIVSNALQAGLAASAVVVQGKITIDSRKKVDGLIRVLRIVRDARDKVAEPVPDMSDLMSRKDEYDDYAKQRSRLRSAIRDIEDDAVVLDKLKDAYDEAVELFEEEVGDVCPICGGELKGEHCAD